MTKDESVLISAYTGFVICKDFSDIHKLIEEKLERPVFTHELGNEDTYKEIRAKLLPDIKELISKIK